MLVFGKHRTVRHVNYATRPWNVDSGIKVWEHCITSREISIKAGHH